MFIQAVCLFVMQLTNACMLRKVGWNANNSVYIKVGQADQVDLI